MVGKPGESTTPGTGGTPPTGSGTPPAPGGASVISIEVLPEEFRGLPEKQVQFLLSKMAQGLETQNALNKRLQAELEELKKRPAAPGQSRAYREEEPKPDKPKKPIKELMEEDPEAALEEWAARRFGTELSRLNAIEDRVAEAEFNIVRDQFDDFHEYEEDIRTILEESGAAKNRTNIMGAYTMAVGQRVLMERRGKKAALSNSEPAAPPSGDPPKKEYPKTQLTEEIRIASGLTEEQFYEEFDSSNPLNIKLPGVG